MSCIILQTHLISFYIQGYSKHTSRCDLVWAALFARDYPEVPSHEAVVVATSASEAVRIINIQYFLSKKTHGIFYVFCIF